jgi:hypothetical protein
MATEDEIRQARTEVVAWLRDGAITNSPMFTLGHPDESLQARHAAIADRFREVVMRAGFRLEVVEVNPSAFDPRWTLDGAEFVGFKQPNSATSPDDAALLACAALLRNDWCRERLKAQKL